MTEKLLWFSAERFHCKRGGFSWKCSSHGCWKAVFTFLSLRSCCGSRLDSSFGTSFIKPRKACSRQITGRNCCFFSSIPLTFRISVSHATWPCFSALTWPFAGILALSIRASGALVCRWGSWLFSGWRARTSKSLILLRGKSGISIFLFHDGRYWFGACFLPRKANVTFLKVSDSQGNWSRPDCSSDFCQVNG